LDCERDVARGTDTGAHEGALAANGKTIANLAHGIEGIKFFQITIGVMFPRNIPFVDD
jgi:hypothetical protein